MACNSYTGGKSSQALKDFFRLASGVDNRGGNI